MRPRCVGGRALTQNCRSGHGLHCHFGGGCIDWHMPGRTIMLAHDYAGSRNTDEPDPPPRPCWRPCLPWSTDRPSSFAPIFSRSSRTRSTITAATACRPGRCGSFAPNSSNSSARVRPASSRPISRSFSTNPRIPSARRSIRPIRRNRSAPPEDLIPQFPLMRASVRAFGLTPIEQDRYEADDLIATYARQARKRGADVLIISADKDLMQLIGPGVAMYDPASGEAGAKGAREERKIGRSRSARLFRRAARKSRRRSGARRRFDRQCARRTRHRDQDRRTTHR